MSILRLTANMMMAATAGERCSIQPMRFWIGHMAGREWASGDEFSLADCAAAPSLLYADWTYAIAEEFTNVRNYRRRLLARPSYARALDEARPFRHLFPLGAPEEGRD
ncbi:glutathione S-transferase domain-containing protein [Brucella intermedia LMG 3301]|uniref:Glutathione S-transferase domain-containing protein n=1 Tax=Brucella intermedia LMG 3301 TaxID=641118 RepID=C4WPH8_9HYPH|nr:glutathione S-transferase domain-containing protein [Brucella intermedia LMG 3301]